MGPAATAMFSGFPPGNSAAAKDASSAFPPAAFMQPRMEKQAKMENLQSWSFQQEDFSADAVGMPPALPFVNGGFDFSSSLDDFNEPKQTSAQEDADAAELEALLDFTEETESAENRKYVTDLDDGFDGTEMSILYSFLVDAPEKKTSSPAAVESPDDGLLNLNVLSSSPLTSFMDSLESDFTDEEFKLTPPAAMPKAMEPKSRRLCRQDGCYKRSRSNGLCISHGGGRRCAIEGCDKSSQGGNLCIRHGGGKRCSHEGCTKAAQSNFLCKAHGGGPRCQVDGCTRSSQGGGFCRSHGGGKRCRTKGCDKGTQRGDYCALHGGSRLCEVSGCMRNDRGGGLCATHGGGKRCKSDGCDKPCRRRGLCSAHLRQMEGTNH